MMFVHYTNSISVDSKNQNKTKKQFLIFKKNQENGLKVHLQPP